MTPSHDRDAAPERRVLTASGAPLFASLPPEQTAALRGLLWAVIGAVLAAVTVYVQSGGFEAMPPAVTATVILTLRVIEGLIDAASVEPAEPDQDPS